MRLVQSNDLAMGTTFAIVQGMKTNESSTSKWFAVSNKRHGIVGWIEMFWCASAQRYVTIPGVSRWRNQ